MLTQLSSQSVDRFLLCEASFYTIKTKHAYHTNGLLYGIVRVLITQIKCDWHSAVTNITQHFYSVTTVLPYHSKACKHLVYSFHPVDVASLEYIE